jgi:Carboxypeptidase regulatory-like domain
MKALKTVMFLLLTLALAWAFPAFGQSDRGSITGTVKDQNGGVVPNAKVTATNIDTGEVRKTMTGNEGAFTLSELKAASYRLTVEAAGFKTSTIDKFQLGVQIIRRADVTLEAGAVSEKITVTSEAPVLQTDSPAQQLNVTERQVRELPLLVAAESGGRSPLAFIFLDSSVYSNGATSSGTNATNFRINGSQGLGQDILIDGAGTRRGENGTFFSEVAPAPNAFQEFTINSSNYSAEFGNSSGGVINFTLKSGGNDFHGDGYLYLINEAFNANIALNRLTDLPRPRDRQKDFGFTIGGPVRLPKKVFGPLGYDGRNRTFFFFNYGGYRTTQSESVDVSVPTARMRNGDFGELLTDPKVLQFFGGPVQIYDPRQPAGQRVAFTGNIIPTSAIDPVGRNFVNLFPLPNQTGPLGSSVFHNYRASSVATAETNYYVTKITQVLSSNQQLNFSGTYRKLPSTKGGFPRFPEPFVAQGVWDQTFRSYYFRLQHDYTITSRLLNHVNLGWNRTDVQNFNFGRGVGRATALGLQPGTTQDLGQPLIGFPGYGNPVTSVDPRAYQTGGSTFFDNRVGDNTAEFSDNVTYTRGRHTFKFGGDARRQQLNVNFHFDIGGNFNFRSNQTGNTSDFNQGWPIASMLTGKPEFSFNSLQTIAPSFEYLFAAGFVQDDIKVTSKLTLNVGVRYDYDRPRDERHDRYRGFYPDVANPAAGGRRGAIVGAVGQGGLQAVNRGLINPDLTDIGPRLGFAYAINNKTVVRGGYGLYYAPLFYNANGQDGLIGYAPGQVNINDRLDSIITLSNYPKLPIADPNAQYVGQLDRNDIDLYDKNYKLGRTAQYDLSVQRELPYNFALSLSYIGSKGTRLRSGFNPPNALPIEALKLGNALLTKSLVDVTQSDRDYASSVGFTLPASPDAVYPGFNNAGGRFSGTVAQALRPFPQYGPINNRLESQGQSWYNALKVDLQRRFSKGMQIGSSYTFSKLITNAAEDLYGGSPLTGVLQNPADRRSLRSLSPNDVKHSLVVNYIVELPFGKDKRFLNRGRLVDRLAGGFQVSAIQRYRSGTPLTPVILGGQREFLDLVGIGGNLRPNLTGQPFFLDQAAIDASYTANGGVRYRALNLAAFARPKSFTGTSAPIGSAEYRAYYANPLAFLGSAAPTFDNLRTLPFYGEDLSILKKTRITETMLLEIRAEFFNVFNRGRFAAPDTNLDNPGNFGIQGRFSDIFQPRRIQLGARFIF